MKTLLRISAIALLVSVSAMGFNTNANISVSRSPGAVSVPPGGSAPVTLTVDVGAIGASPIRGFYLTEYIPPGFSITGDEVRINGLLVNGHLRETVEGGLVHAGFTAERWVLETPPSWSQNHPVNAMSTVTISYQLQVPANAVIGAYSLPGASWASMIPGIGDAGDDFGYESAPPVVNVIETPPAMVTQPQDQTGYEGLTVTFTAGASGGNLSYQWRASGINIPGAAAASYTTAALTPADNGKTFDCVISNSAGQITSRTATLTVLQGLFYTLKDNRFKKYITLGAGSALNINGAAQADGQRFQKVDAGAGEYYLKLAGAALYVALGAGDQLFATAATTAAAARFSDHDCASNGDGGLGIECVSDDDADSYLKSLAADQVGAANGTCNPADATSWERFFFEIVSGGDTEAPSIPAGVSAAEAGPYQINISWSASTDNTGVTGYTVEYREAGGVFALLANTPAFTAQAAGLTPNTAYEFRVAARDAAGNQSQWSAVVAESTPDLPPDTQAPSVPGNVSASPLSSSSISVSWNAATDNVGVTGYQVEYRQAGGTFALLTTTVSTSASATGLAPLTAYEFRVLARDGAGNQSAWSAAASASTPDVSANPMVLLKDNRYKQYITIGAGSALSINAALAADAQVFEKADAGGGEYYLKLAGVETYVALGANDQMFATATGTATAARFADRDCAYNGDGGLGIQCMNDDDAAPYMKSLGVNEVGAANGTCSAADGTSWERFYFESVSGGDVTAPSVPAAVSAGAVSPSQINISWGASTDNVGVTAYIVEFREQGGTFALLASTPGLSASATGLAASKTYEFRVRAEDAAGNRSAWSATASAATPGSSTPVRLNIVSADASSAQAPHVAANTIDGSMATRWAADGDGQWVRYRLSGRETVSEIRIAFYNGAARQTYFEIQFSDDGVNWTAAGGRQTSSGSTTALEVFNLPAASAQWVRYLGHGNSANTWNSMFEVEIYGSGTPPDGEAPSIPGSLSALAVSSSRIDLSWNASTDNTAVTGYDVEYRAAGGSFAVLASTAGTSASATGLSSETEYEFRVRAKDAAGNVSLWSVSALETTPALPPDTQAPSIPSGLSAAAAGPYQVNIAWTASSDNVGVTAYRVEYRAAGGSFSLLTAAAGTSVSATGLIPLTTYEFRVLAEDAAGNRSAWSVIASAATPDNSQPVKLTVLSADASSAEAPNYAVNSIDGNAGTRWAAFGDGEWARYQLSAQAVVSTVKVSFYAGAARQTYFEIQVSNDGVNWTTIGGRQTSSGTTTGLETFDLPDTSARWVRYLGHGNSVHTWNSIYELEVYGQP